MTTANTIAGILGEYFFYPKHNHSHGTPPKRGTPQHGDSDTVMFIGHGTPPKRGTPQH